MRGLLRKCSALFLLSLFLFPQVEKGVHDSVYPEKLNCNATEKHLHEQSHSCSLCDFAPLSTTVPLEHSFDFALTLFLTFEFSDYNPGALSTSSLFVSLRAPPSVS